MKEVEEFMYLGCGLKGNYEVISILEKMDVQNEWTGKS